LAQSKVNPLDGGFMSDERRVNVVSLFGSLRRGSFNAMLARALPAPGPKNRESLFASFSSEKEGPSFSILHHGSSHPLGRCGFAHRAGGQ